MIRNFRLRAVFSCGLAAMAAAPLWPQSPPSGTSVIAPSAPIAPQAGTRAGTKHDVRRGRQAFEAGAAAERAGNLSAALHAYEDAVRFAPEKADYRVRLEAVRFALIQEHTARAERDAVAGRSEAARNELRAAVALDAGYRTAQERLQQLERQSLREQDTVPAFSTVLPALEPQPGTRTIDYRGDARGAYTEIARQFGLAAAFDEDTQTRPMRFRVGEVDFPTAMRVLGQQTKTFWRAIDAHTFFVANDTPEKRKEYLPFIERTIVLPESDRPEQMNEMLRVVREFGGLTHAQLETATRTLTLRGSEPDVALADELIRELEQARGEIMLEVEILEIERDAAQRLGITPPSSAKAVSLSQQQIRLAQQSAAGLVQVLEQLFGTPSSLSGSTPAQIAALLGTGGISLSTLVPPLVAFGGGKTVFLGTLPGATADFAETLSAVRGARRVLLRAKDGEPATFFVGDRFPISLAVLSSGGTSGGGATPNVGIHTFTTGAGPAAVVSAAFRTNGHLDLATANAGQGANTVSVLLGNGDGTFGTNTDIAVGTSPVALVAADFRGNGMTDLAVVNSAGTAQFPALNIVASPNGASAPSGVATIATTTPHGLSVGQPVTLAGVGVAAYNGTFVVTAVIDPTHFTVPLAGAPAPSGGGTVTSAGNTVSILLGNGDGTFQPKTDIAAGITPSAIVAGHFTASGHLDLAVANAGSSTVPGSSSVTILPGNGDGTFQSPITPLTKNIAASPAGASVTANVATIQTTTSHGLSVGLTVTLSGVGLPVYDGSFVVTAVPDSTHFSFVLVGTPAPSGGGTVTIQASVTTPLGTNIVPAPNGANVIANVATIQTATPHGLSVGQTVTLAGVGVAAYDGTFVVTAVIDSTHFSFALVGTPAPSGGGVVTADRGPFGLATGHFGALQIAASPSGASVTANVATITTTTPHGLSVGQSVSIAGVGVAAYNGTFVVTAIVDPMNFSFALSGTPAPSGGGTVAINGSADLATANSRTDNVSVLFGDGKGGFTTETDIGVGTRPVAVTTADFNGDSIPDLAVANAGSDSISILLGTSSPTRTTPFSAPSTLLLTSGSQPSALAAADFNSDSHVDLAVADGNASAVTIVFGNGDGTFTNSVSFPTGSQPSGLATGDFNGDNLTDLAISNANGNSVTVILNSTSINFNQNAQTPYPSIQFEDIGLKLKATPRIHPRGEVTLHMEIELRSLSASNFNSIPIISNRSVDETMRLRIDEPSVLAGIFTENQMRAVTGLPGAATASGIGYAAGRHNSQEQRTELIIVVTPRLLRPAPRLGRTRYLGPGGEPAGVVAEPGEPTPP